MLSWAITFLVVAIIAGVLGLSGVAGTATQIAYVLFVVFLIFAAVGFIKGRRPPVTSQEMSWLEGVRDRHASSRHGNRPTGNLQAVSYGAGVDGQLLDCHRKNGTGPCSPRS